MESKLQSPPLKKKTNLYQILLFAAGLVAFLIDDPQVLEFFNGNVDVLVMASSAIAVGLSFTKPSLPKENLEVLEGIPDED